MGPSFSWIAPKRNWALKHQELQNQGEASLQRPERTCYLDQSPRFCRVWQKPASVLLPNERRPGTKLPAGIVNRPVAEPQLAAVEIEAQRVVELVISAE